MPEDNDRLAGALIILQYEMLEYVRRERDKQRKRQATIGDIKRRCGVITPEKS